MQGIKTGRCKRVIIWFLRLGSLSAHVSFKVKPEKIKSSHAEKGVESISG